MLTFLFSAKGRVSRREIWLKFFLPYLALSIAAGIVDTGLIGTANPELGQAGPLGSVVDLFFLWPNFAVAAKRFHDRGMSGWWPLYLVLITFVGIALLVAGAALSGIDIAAMVQSEETPDLSGIELAYLLPGLFVIIAAAIWNFVVLYVLPGQRGPNQYGPDPLHPEQSADVFS